MMLRKASFAFFLSIVAFSVSAQFKLYEKGHDSYAAGKYDEAITLFSEYLTKTTRDKSMDVEVFYLRALSYYKKNDFKKAIGDFEETLLQEHKNKGNIHWFKAKCHLKLGEKSDAISDYTSAIRILDSLPDSKAKLLMERGKVFEESTEYELAAKDYESVIALQPNHPEASKALVDYDKRFSTSRSVPQEQANATTTAKVDQKNDSKKADTGAQKNNVTPQQSTPVTTPANARTQQKDDKNNVEQKKEEKPTQRKPQTTPPQQSNKDQSALATNDVNTESGDPSTEDKPSFGQKVKNVAGKVGDKVSDTFRGDGDNKPTEQSAQQQSVPKQNQTVAKNTDSKKPSTTANTSRTQQQTNTKPSQPTLPAGEVSGPQTLEEQYREEKRFALVIGNSAYPKSIGVLRNPVNDATDLAKELTASNFDVQLLTNATYGQMRAAMLKFKDKIDAGDKDKTVSLFYFAGHGLQYEDENYLVPVDAMIEYQDDIGRYCFGVQKMVLANMERSNSRMNIVILDACRNNPFPALTRSMGNQGLGEMRRARGSFIAYATAPGSVASDGSGRNGLYTQELLKAMRKPGLTIEQVFKEVRAKVLQLSNDKQNTWDSSNIIGEFYFKLPQ